MMDVLAQAACVAVISTLVSESMVMSRFRDSIDTYFVHCPICMGIWLALPCLWFGPLHYFLVVATSNLWMLIILKLYNELEGSNEQSTTRS